MTTTVFVNGVTLTDAPWFNDVDQITYDSDGASFVDFTQPGIGSTGAVARAISDLFLDRVSLMNCLSVAQRAEVRAGTKLADYRALVQAYLDGIVAQGRKTVVVVEPGTVWRLDSGITIDASKIQLQAQGATFSFAQQAAGSAISITKADLQTTLGGLRVEGNSSSGSVKGINLTGTVGSNVDVVKIADFVVFQFGTGVYCGDYAYLVSFDNFELAECTTMFESAGTTGGGSRLNLINFLLTSTVSGAIGIKNTNLNADIYCFGGAIECDVLVNQSRGRIHFYGMHLEANDWPSTPILVTGGQAYFAMYGGEILSNQSTITAQNLISVDSSASNGGAVFHGVYMQFGNTASGAFAGGTGEAQVSVQMPFGTHAFTYSSGFNMEYGRIQFPAAQSGSSDVNTLDDYEEGTFNPTVLGDGAAGVTTYTTQLGRYTKIGRAVHFIIDLVWSNMTGTGNLVFGGLPFTATATTTNACAVRVSGLAYTANAFLQAAVLAGTTTPQLSQVTNGAAAALVPVDTAATVQFCGTYFV